MKRETAKPTLNEHGDEVHPAFGLARVNRWTSNPGTVLFDSVVRHTSTVVLTVSRASRRRDLHRDYLSGVGLPDIVEIEMSEAQWGALVSSFGDGAGVPVTIRRTENDFFPAGLPPEERLALSIAETKDAAHAAVKLVADAMNAYDEIAKTGTVKQKREALHHLRCMIDNLPGNVEFAAKSLAEHAENVVTKAKFDIEAMAVAAAERAGRALPGSAEVFALPAAPERAS